MKQNILSGVAIALSVIAIIASVARSQPNQPTDVATKQDVVAAEQRVREIKDQYSDRFMKQHEKIVDLIRDVRLLKEKTGMQPPAGN